MTLDFLPPQAYTKETLLKAYNWLQSQSDQVKELATTPDHLVSLYLKSSRLNPDSLTKFSQLTHTQPHNGQSNLSSTKINSNSTYFDIPSGSNSTAQSILPPTQILQQNNHHTVQHSQQNVVLQAPPQSSPKAQNHDTSERPSLQNFKSELKNLAGIMGDLEKGPQAFVGATTVHPNSAPFGAAAHFQNSTNSTQTTQQSSVSVHQTQIVSQTTTHQSFIQLFDDYTQNLIREVKNELNLSTDLEAVRLLVKIGYQKVRSLYK
jgi:hypothetical protein